MTALPPFRYHLDPVASGSVEPSDAKCDCCRKARGVAYVGPVYGEFDEDEPVVCPWCIADGSAHKKLDATFVDSEAFDAGAPEAAMQLICERTPGFSAWRGDRWPSCCDEPAAFVTPASASDIRTRFPALEGPLMMHIVHDHDASGATAQRLFDALSRDDSPTAFVFQCLHCDNMPVYIDKL